MIMVISHEGVILQNRLLYEYINTSVINWSVSGRAAPAQCGVRTSHPAMNIITHKRPYGLSIRINNPFAGSRRATGLNERRCQIQGVDQKTLICR